MSMSTLGNQLASLSSSTAQKGIIHSTSRANNDGIGRGFHHSTKHGHTISSGDVSRRPSILYDNAREAAEVTLVTLRENAIGALESLAEATTSSSSSSSGGIDSPWKNAEFMGNLGLLSLHNLTNFERGTATSSQNVQVDKSIEKLLTLLMTVMAEIPPKTSSNDDGVSDVNSNQILVAVLHIIEYLLRHYSVHTRGATASYLLQTFLPLQITYPSAYPHLFGRVLSLVDLQTMPEWTWLRPFAARDAPPLNRGVLSKRVAKDDALVGIIGKIAKRGMEICIAEGELGRQDEMQIDGVNGDEAGGTKSGGAVKVRRGISTLLSFSASILVEALHIQSSSKDAGVTGGVQESFVRILFPLVVSACKSGSGEGQEYYCSEWKEWGRLVASTLVMLCPLSGDVKVALCDAIVEGLPASGIKKKKQPFQEAVNDITLGGNSGLSSLGSKDADDASSAIMTLLSVLGTMSQQDSDNQDEDDGSNWEYYLPMLPPKRNKRKKNTVIDYLGCELPLSTYKKLLSKDCSTGMAMGAILQSLSEDEEDDASEVIVERMAPLLSSIVMHAFARLEKEAGKVLSSSLNKKKSKKSKGAAKDESVMTKFKADRDVLLILSLIKEPSLSSLWNSKTSSLVAAVTVNTLTSYDNLHQEGSSSSVMIMERYSSILKGLSTVNSVVHDQGVAYAINNTIAKNSDGSSLAKIAKLLGRDISPSSISDKSPRKGGQATKEGSTDHLDISSLLPTRVALESADASVRLEAIKKIIQNKNDNEGGMDADLGQALLRRLIDDDADVAIAAGEFVADQFKKKSVMDDKDQMEVEGSFASLLVDNNGDLRPLAKEALASLLHWTFIGKEDSDSWSPMTTSSAITPSKKKKGKNKNAVVSSPLLSCISICGSVAKLLLEEVSIENSMNVDDDDDSDGDSISHLFYALFLCLGAHVNSAGSEVSKAASTELLKLFNNDEGTYANVAQVITMHPVSHTMMAHFFNGKKKTNMIAVTKSLRSRFLWFALHSYSDKLATTLSSSKNDKESSFAILQITLTLTLYQMQSYKKESKNSNNASFQWEMQFLGDMCKRYLSSVGDGSEKAIMELASTSSSVSFEEIVKPVIISSLLKHTVLLYACLQPHASKEGTSRLLAIAHESLSNKIIMDSKGARECIIPSFALLSHPDRSIRERVIELIGQYPSVVKKDEMVLDICSKATDKSSPLRSSLVMDGANTLSNLMGQIVSSSGSLKFLIESCKSCALKGNGKLSNGGCQASAIILSAMEKAGENAFPLLKRWDFAGKELFQAFLSYDKNNDELVVLSSSVGRLRDCVLSMLKGVLVNEAQAGDDGLSIQISIGPSKTGRRMRSYSVGASDESFTTLEPYPETMLKAILEALSSSSSSSDDESQSPLLLSKHVIQLAISRPSWANGVFPKLGSKSRNAIASALLQLRARDNVEAAGSALLGLPLKSSDFIQLLKEVEDASQSEINQAAVVFITDCVRGKLDTSLGGTADISKLSSKLFDQLLSLSSVKNSSAISEGDSGGRDYTRVSILQTLFAIHSHYKSQLSKKSLEKDGSKLSASKRRRSRSHSDVGGSKALASHADLLVGLVGGNASAIYPLNSGRGRALSLSLLTCLCEESPSAVVTSLLPALMSLAGAPSPSADKSPDKKVDMNALGDALVAIVPAYCTHAPSANLSLFSLLESFVGKIIVPGSDNEKSRYTLLDRLVDSLKLLPTKESSSDAIASLAACVMALQAFNLQKPTTTSDADSEMSDTDPESQTRLDVRVLANTTRGVKIAVSLSLLQYAEKLMSYICGLSSFSAGEMSSSKMKVDISEVASLALRGSNAEGIGAPAAYSTLSKAHQRSILYLAINLLQSVRDVLSTPEARRVVRKSKGDDADLCLRLWNELMQTHTNTLRAHAKLADGSTSSLEKRFWDAAPIATSDCLENLQNLLPVPHFLASVSSALGDEAVDTYIRKKSIRLLADRVSELSADSPEALLFLEMVPDLVAQVDVDRSTAAQGEDSLASMRRTIVIQQGALIAIESFVRSLYPSTENGKSAANAAAIFLPALASVTRLLDNTASSWIKANGKGGDGVSSGVADAECQLLSSSSLCVSTLVTTLKARCLPQLPSIIKPLMASLKSVNALLEGANDQAASTGELLQLSILKTLQAIAETLPQFLLPYLPLVFSDYALPSKALRQGHGQGEHSVRAAAMQVEIALATRVQIRQLIPALSKSLSKNLQSEGSVNWQGACSIIDVMNIAVESSQRPDLSPIIGKIFNGLVMAYGYEGNGISRPQLLKHANKCLLSLVMKLSEAQLRPLYARLREWRGGIEDDESEEMVTSMRRHAFWSLSAELSKSLRSIFLPCLTSVVTDVIDELEIAVSLLCRRSKKSEGSKRRRVEESDESSEDVDDVLPLQPLLLCLESALKADAHEGGDWTRGDDNQRYNMILSHLGKLLLAQVPKDFPIQSDLSPKEQASTSAYQQLVQGVGTMEHGNVVGCLTALAAAAGNEQLWKPLNFAVLEACGHKRSEVRKAGISCLLSIIETIGEEYMVLLPECLPVLSELLEDDDEIAGMAKECVRQGEELLGESLEDSLR